METPAAAVRTVLGVLNLFFRVTALMIDGTGIGC
jgi:hypothetical protein